MKNYLLPFFFVLIFFVSPFYSFSQSDSLDLTFGTGGYVVTDIDQFSDGVTAVATQSDGKIIAAGYGNDNTGSYINLVLTRYSASGELDMTFGTNGIVVEEMPPSHSNLITDMVIQNDGKIVVVGAIFNNTTGLDLVVYRFNSDGTTDEDFGNNGQVIWVGDGGAVSDVANAVVVLENGKIMIAGSASFNFLVMLLNPDGSFDNTFEDQGVLILDPFNNAGGRFLDIIIQSNKKILAGGYTPLGSSGESEMVLFRMEANGARDTNFGNEGILAIEEGRAILSMCQLPDGKLILGGTINEDLDTDFGFVKLNNDGSIDTDFGNDGIVETDFGEKEVVTSVLSQGDGKFIAVGISNDDFNNNTVAIARYLEDGMLDDSFGGDGKLYHLYSSGNLQSDKANAAVVKGEKLIVGGATNFQAPNSQFVVAQYDLGDIILDNENILRQDFGLSIYPNPVTDNLFIKKENSETLKYQITDISGRILMNGELVDEINNITFTKINSGVYFVKIINPTTREYIVEKIVK